MRCPSCQSEDTRVIDTRLIDDGSIIRRRRQCPSCDFRFSTNEQIEILSLDVVKSDGSEEPYDKEKLLRSLKTPLYKRPVSPLRIKRMMHRVEQEVQAKARKDKITSKKIGEIVMKNLKRADKVAYIRFASVYRQFEDIEEFQEELEKLIPKKRSTKSNKTKK